jgi:penicillin-binding protein 2
MSRIFSRLLGDRDLSSAPPEDPAPRQGRLSLLSLLITLGFLAALGWLWYLQGMGGAHYRILSEQNRSRLVSISPPRGILYDRHGVPLVQNAPSFTIAVTPEYLDPQGKTLARLARHLHLPVEALQERLDRTAHRRPHEAVKIRERASWEEVARVEAHRLDLPGVQVEVEVTRHYPYGPLSAHLLGYIGRLTPDQARQPGLSLLPRDSLIGQYGMEKSYDPLLRGTPGAKVLEVNALGQEIRALGLWEPLSGDDLILTLDLKLQQAAEEALGNAAGAIVAMDVRSGEILALVSHPSFDPNLFTRGGTSQTRTRLFRDPDYPLSNRALQNQYPPGSVFKIILAAAGLETGAITPDHQATCRGGIPFGNRVFRCWRKGGHGAVDLRRAIVESCDVYFYLLGQKLGVDRIADYAQRFGLGQPTGIPLASEKPGLIPTSLWKQTVKRQPWYAGETLSVAIGQGYVLTTPLQLAVMTSAVANGGTLYQPRLLRFVAGTHQNPTTEYLPREIPQPPLAPETLAFLREALVGVVTQPGGTGGAARSPVVTIGGKTGTAQVVALGAKRREGGKKIGDHAWFAAFAPAENPEIAVVVLVEHGGHGGAAAAPKAKRVIEEYIRHARS